MANTEQTYQNTEHTTQTLNKTQKCSVKETRFGVALPQKYKFWGKSTPINLGRFTPTFHQVSEQTYQNT